MFLNFFLYKDSFELIYFKFYFQSKNVFINDKKIFNFLF